MLLAACELAEQAGSVNGEHTAEETASETSSMEAIKSKLIKFNAGAIPY